MSVLQNLYSKCDTVFISIFINNREPLQMGRDLQWFTVFTWSTMKWEINGSWIKNEDLDSIPVHALIR